MKRSLLLLFALLPQATAFSQVTALPPNIRAAFTLERLRTLNPNDITYGIPLPEKQLVGDVYLHNNWRSGSLILYASETRLDGYPLRLDLLRNEMEVRSRSGIKVIAVNAIKAFSWVDSVQTIPQYFVNAKDYNAEDEIPLTGFFQVLADGRLSLFNIQLQSSKRQTTTSSSTSAARTTAS